MHELNASLVRGTFLDLHGNEVRVDVPTACFFQLTPLSPVGMNQRFKRYAFPSSSTCNTFMSLTPIDGVSHKKTIAQWNLAQRGFTTRLCTRILWHKLLPKF